MVVTPSCSDHKKDYLEVTHKLVWWSTLMAALGISNAMLRLALFPGPTCQIEMVAKKLAILYICIPEQMNCRQPKYTVEILGMERITVRTETGFKIQCDLMVPLHREMNDHNRIVCTSFNIAWGYECWV